MVTVIMGAITTNNEDRGYRFVTTSLLTRQTERRAERLVMQPV